MLINDRYALVSGTKPDGAADVCFRPKDQWLWAIVERSGKCKAAVALANKNVRTAWAMLTQTTEYQRNPLAA